MSLDKDDLGATDFEALCSSGVRLRHRQKGVDEMMYARRGGGPLQRRGAWSATASCPKHVPAICGVKVRAICVSCERLKRRRDRVAFRFARFQARLDADPRAGGLGHETPDVKDDEAGLTEVQFRCCKVENG